MTALPASYQPLDAPALAAASAKAWLSPQIDDPAWDDFLRSTPLGQYQQSSLWAEFKAGEGWQHHRVVATDGSAAIVGGFQILWRQKGPVRIGYLSKGPVALATVPHLADALVRLLLTSTRGLCLSALIVQPPDEDRIFTNPCLTAGFLTSNPMRVIEATYLIDLQPDMETLRQRMSASLRRNLRKAKKRPSTLRTGGREDLGIFYDLMAATCQRQKTSPNPGSVDAIRRLWDIFSKTNSVRLTLVECEGQIPAAKLSLCFGNRLTVWKKGWNGGFSDWHPNELLEDDALEWGRSNGYQVCDFCSFSTRDAEAVVSGKSAEDLQLSSRDEYHLRFGGLPKLLPRALLFIPNRWSRWLYRHSFHRLELRRRADRNND